MKIYYNKRKYRFKTSSTKDGPPGYRERDNQPIVVLCRVSPEEEETRYLIQFDDGKIMDAFEDEVALLGDS